MYNDLLMIFFMIVTFHNGMRFSRNFNKPRIGDAVADINVTRMVGNIIIAVAAIALMIFIPVPKG